MTKIPLHRRMAALGCEITIKEQLWEYLRVAIELELSTIPAYLSGLYSLVPGKNQQTYDVIQSVVMEEMLHLTLAGNVLNAVNGEAQEWQRQHGPAKCDEIAGCHTGPHEWSDRSCCGLAAVNCEHYVPRYPTRLPLSGELFRVSVARFSRASLGTYLRIEQPEERGDDCVEGYHSIGQFYAALEQGLRNLKKEIGAEALYDGDPAWQVTPTEYYGGAGKVIVVAAAGDTPDERHDKALRALEEIVDQGEGLDYGVFDGDEVPAKDPTHGDVPVPAHYFRFDELRQRQYYQAGDKPGDPSGPRLRIDWDAVYPMKANPRMRWFEEHGKPGIAKQLLEFNRAYMAVLDSLQSAFTGNPGTLMLAVTQMYDLKYQAEALMKVPHPDGRSTVGPSFEYVPPDQR